MNNENLDKIFERVQKFQGESLTGKISQIESDYHGKRKDDISDLNLNYFINSNLLASAFEIKRLAGQINVIVHAVGILNALPYILEKEESINSLSLGAGNTGRGFDLETNLRVAEFKFISWQGGSEAIRQNQLFKDFYNLAEHETQKRKELYVINKEIPIKFLNGNRALPSVMSKNKTLWDDFQNKYGNQYEVVYDYFSPRKGVVNIIDLADFNEMYKSQFVSTKENRENEPMQNNTKGKPSSANEIREYAIKKYILPAKAAGFSTVKILAKDVHSALGYKNSYPNVCQSLDGDKFLELANVVLVSRKGPLKSNTVEWVFEI